MSKIKLILFLIVLVIILVIFAVCLYRQPADSGVASLSWNPNTEANLAGYKVYYGTQPRNDSCPPGDYDNIIDVGNNTTYQLNDLRNDQNYYFSITSYNTAGKESCFSEEGKKFVPPLAPIDRVKQLLNI